MSDGRIVDQVRFRQRPSRPAAGPALAWQVLHTIAATSELYQIQHRLGAIERKLRELQMEEDAELVARLHWAADILRDILQEYAETGVISSSMITALLLAQKEAYVARARTEVLAIQFHGEIEAIKSAQGRKKILRAVDFMKHDRERLLFHAHLLAQASALHLSAAHVRVLEAAQLESADLDRRTQRLREELKREQRHLSLLATLEEFGEDIEACIDGMGRIPTLLAHNVIKQARALTTEVGATPTVEAMPYYSYLIWEDDDGTRRSRLLPPATVEAAPEA